MARQPPTHENYHIHVSDPNLLQNNRINLAISKLTGLQTMFQKIIVGKLCFGMSIFDHSQLISLGTRHNQSIAS